MFENTGVDRIDLISFNGCYLIALSIFVLSGLRSLRITESQLYDFSPKYNEPVAQQASTKVICLWLRFMNSIADAVAFCMMLFFEPTIVYIEYN